jgi:hypothetical protein
MKHAKTQFKAIIKKIFITSEKNADIQRKWRLWTEKDNRRDNRRG